MHSPRLAISPQRHAIVHGGLRAIAKGGGVVGGGLSDRTKRHGVGKVGMGLLAKRGGEAARRLALMADRGGAATARLRAITNSCCIAIGGLTEIPHSRGACPRRLAVHPQSGRVIYLRRISTHSRSASRAQRQAVDH